MDAFDTLIEHMVREGKATKALAKKKKTPDSTTPEVSRAVNPWTNEALVLIATNLICDNCGNESLSWNQSLYIERINKRFRNPVTEYEQINFCSYASVYGSLPKRTEMLVKHSCTCPLCFGIGDNRGNKLVGEMLPTQLSLTLGEKK